MHKFLEPTKEEELFHKGERNQQNQHTILPNNIFKKMETRALL
jgi:hypothetical protein